MDQASSVNSEKVSGAIAINHTSSVSSLKSYGATAMTQHKLKKLSKALSASLIANTRLASGLGFSALL